MTPRGDSRRMAVCAFVGQPTATAAVIIIVPIDFYLSKKNYDVST